MSLEEATSLLMSVIMIINSRGPSTVPGPGVPHLLQDDHH